MAALKMQEASREVHKFDVGSLAEVSCQAKDAGSEESVLAVLRCIFRVTAIPEKGKEHPHLLKMNKMSDVQPMRRFVGAVPVSAVDILMDRSKKKSGSAEKKTTGVDSSGSFSSVGWASGIEISESETNELLDVLKAGLSVASLLGKKEALGTSCQSRQLLSIWWACRGISCNETRVEIKEVPQRDFQLTDPVCWSAVGFLSSMELKKPSTAVLKDKRKAKIIAASAFIETQSQFESDKDAVAYFEKSAGLERSCNEAVSIRAVKIL